MHRTFIKHEYKNGKIQKWTAFSKIKERLYGLTYITIQAKGSSFDTVLGRPGNINFIVIRDTDIGCGLAAFREVSWNTCKLSRFLDETDAATIAHVLKDLGETEIFE